MKPIPLVFAAGLLALVAGCTTTAVKESRVPIKEDAHFTIAHFEPSQVDVPAKPTKMVPPGIRFTEDDLAAGAFDEYAVVEYIVDPAGNPREVQWVETSDAAFARAAVTAITNSRFSPARKDGKAVAMNLKTRFAYNFPLGTSVRYDGQAQQTHYTEEAPGFPYGSRDPFDRGTYQHQ